MAPWKYESQYQKTKKKKRLSGLVILLGKKNVKENWL